jgi:transcriptional regulator with XRE-family HTH domain
MEWNLHLNWQLLVEEARGRRQARGLTQYRLAEIAGVSLRTVSRFERRGKDIQMSSVLSILHVLGMADKRTFEFQQEEPVFDSSRRIVRFHGLDGSEQVQCAIPLETLEDRFGRNLRDPIAVFKTNREAIEQCARRKYLRGGAEPDGSILIRVSDLILGWTEH